LHSGSVWFESLFSHQLYLMRIVMLFLSRTMRARTSIRPRPFST
jgi:hypothetical protein